MNAPHPVGVIHGRFQVLHLDHLRYLLAGKARCRHLVVGVTNPDPFLTRTESADPDRSDPLANPLTYYERSCLVRAALVEVGIPWPDFSVVPLPINIPELIQYYAPREAVYFLTIYDDWGRAKLRRLMGLDLEVELLWERPPEQKGLSGRQVRAAMVQGEDWRRFVPASVAELLEEWDIPRRLRQMAERHAANE